MDRPTKITFADMRAQGVRGILVYCADYRCSHSNRHQRRPLLSGGSSAQPVVST
jgi:hypothetical protein